MSLQVLWSARLPVEERDDLLPVQLLGAHHATICLRRPEPDLSSTYASELSKTGRLGRSSEMPHYADANRT